MFQRVDAFGGLFVQLLSDPFVGGASLVATAPVSPPPGATHIELVLTLTNFGFVARPTGTFRFCTGLPCDGPYQSLESHPSHPDAGALPAWDALGIAHVTLRNTNLEPYTQRLAEFSLEYEAVEDFSDGLFPGNVGYLFHLNGFGTCGSPFDVVESDGVLHLLGTNAPCPEPTNPNVLQSIALAPAAGTPGDQAGRARYRFKVPDRCSNYGVGISSGAVPPPDGVGLTLFRGPNPANPLNQRDVLAVVLNAESLEFPGIFDGPSNPVVASAVVSIDPDSDAALVDITAIEFVLETQDRVPIGSFRLCTAGGCPDEFTFLEPHAPTAFPDALVCGVPASEFDPPGGPFAGGRLQQSNPAGFALYASHYLPEPSRALACFAALASLLVLNSVRNRRNQCR